MKKILAPLAMTAMLAGPITACTTSEATTVGGLALVGAAAGGVIGNDLKAALIGAAIGSAAGAVLVARDRGGWCYYQRPDGTYVKARCQ